MAKGKENLTSLTVIDTHTQEVAFRTAGWNEVRDAAWTSDGSRIFVLGARKHAKYRGRISRAETRFETSHPEFHSAIRHKGELTLSVFGNLGQSPIGEFRVGERPAALARSQDEKWIYVIDIGAPSKDQKKNRNGAVHVVEVDTGKLAASFDVGVLPVPLAARSGSDDFTVFGEDPVNGETGKLYRFRGNQMLPGLELGNELGRDPQKALYLSRENKLAILTMSSQVGIVDLQQNRVEHVVKAGRGGTTSLASVAAGALLMGAVAAGATLAAGAPVFIFPGLGYHPYHLGLISRPDGRVLYALDTSSGDVTAIESLEGTVLSHVKVGRDCGGLFLSASGKLIWALSPDDFMLIDTATNQEGVRHDYGPDMGKMKVWVPMDGNRKLVFLFKKALQVWDAEEGKLLTTVEGLSEPKIVVQSGE
jgi:DNA-binding beta-propeller fold protein YncE